MLFDQHNLPNDVFEIIFATTQQIIVGRVLINYMKANGNEVSKSQMSQFATKLNDGQVITQLHEEPFVGKKVKLSYNKRQFYDRILTPMRSMGLINYDLYKKTYSISPSFSQGLTTIAQMWDKELEQKALVVEFEE